MNANEREERAFTTESTEGTGGREEESFSQGGNEVSEAARNVVLR